VRVSLPNLRANGRQPPRVDDCFGSRYSAGERKLGELVLPCQRVVSPVSVRLAIMVREVRFVVMDRAVGKFHGSSDGLVKG
jgi:hypothetical protein